MDVVLSAENLVKVCTARHLGGAKTAIRALDGASLAIRAGTRMAIVGASGSGKSTLAMCLACVEKADAGAIRFQNRDLAQAGAAELREVRPQIQLVFQDSSSAFNPGFTVSEVLQEPWLLQRKMSAAERRERAGELLAQVGLAGNILRRMTRDLSGGQRQRLAIARALTLKPKVLLLDEALSALDYSVQAQIANLLLDLSDRSMEATERPAIVLITHDLAMAARIADEIAVMESGKVVESGSTRKILQKPEHAATQALLACASASPSSLEKRPGV
ncbi:MAG TPA: dipeptide/oligopeptide/nickel ABC transporter ATP-binding protein [Candidatus Acidoferrum sp.]|nr:dipeptide/oligopeptide/nickel ABC transporter ATP-binding protein [Candidatus Acidoferrum sp.]